MRKHKRSVAWLGWALAPAALFAALMQPQEASKPAMHITTQERLATEPWWPTMGTAPLKAYTGSAACTGCHPEHNSPFPTGMQLAATKGPEAHFLRGPARASFVSDGLTYSLIADRMPLRLSVSKGGLEATRAVDWVFGAGHLGRTFLYQADGRWFQSQASFYSVPSALDITTGFGPSASTSPMAALGNVLTPAEARACFGCHTVHATTSAGLEPLHAEAGVGCEGCHGPGRRHVDKMGGKSDTDSWDQSRDSAIFQPANLSPADSIDFCGACHRSFADANLSTGPQADRAVVRFQPARLQESKCWRATQDKRLTCVACHNPHKPLNRDVAGYDKNCLQCHSGVKQTSSERHIGAVCPKATHDCATCHMPKVNLPSMHGDFTDHYIRIARERDPLPQ